MMINGQNVMTNEERKEIVDLLVKNGYNRAGLVVLDNKTLARVLREFRAESAN